MNAHVREDYNIYVVQTEPNGSATARPLAKTNDPKFEKLFKRIVPFTTPLRGFAKDCWEVTTDNGEEAIMTLSKAQDGELVNADCICIAKFDPDSPSSIEECPRTTSRIRTQDVSVSHPMLASNVGLNRLLVQSVNQPGHVASLSLSEQDMEFVCFAEYDNIKKIGFLDRRDKA